MDKFSKDDVLAVLGGRIREVRMRKGMRQNKVAAECGFHKSGYNAIEAGKRNITVLTLYKIAQVLEEPVSIFFEAGE
ncbi:helix-turn-helix domain-containing protein [Allomuricauda sp. SCSIO 65647]|uniref:helix-turn-helix domain-containing protein n=1 Tax=Allomuricauda sp. SCSIO 65647 TaxID=2908843 RepID=UPI001F182CA0|nr:helix-turn-helix transcriptional regulator [Muricauda sp. SCSIO 65647]UJH69111.1 helix-turn-helix transcriptional regulator [Muricauda sp. SCSIO 65647]